MRDLLRRLRAKFYKWTERRLDVPVEPLLETERLGSVYGGWIIPKNCLSADSVCYLVGAGEDVSFDLALAAAYGCLVHIFDPTPRAVAHVEQLKENLRTGEQTACATSPTGFYPVYSPKLADRLTLHPCGIWEKDDTLRFFAPRNETYVSHSLVNLQQSDRYIEVPVRRLSGVMQELGHRRLDLLKLDIEGAEYQVINSILNDRIEIDALCIEFDESAANHFDGRYLNRIEQSLRDLRAAGYRVVAKEPDCQNYTLVHQRRLQL